MRLRLPPHVAAAGRLVLEPCTWVTRRGWTALLCGTAGLLVYALTGWQELSYAGTSLLALCVLSVALAVGGGGGDVEVALALDRRRVVTGQDGLAQIGVRNRGRRAVSVIASVPVGREGRSHQLVVRRLAPGARRSLELGIATTARGIVPLGPATLVRGDPFGLVRRPLARSAPTELVVHPVTTLLDPSGSGVLHDLEGQTTNDVSPSDLAFHTLRPYVPGDDVRHIHWASSEKLAGSAESAADWSGGDTGLLVRQFVDTRRSHVAVVLDSATSSYAGEEEFELAVSVAASVAARTALDRMELSVVSGTCSAVRLAPVEALDVFARLDPDRTGLGQLVHRVLTEARGASLAVVVTGSTTSSPDLVRATAPVLRRVPGLVVRVVQGASPAVRRVSGLPLLAVGNLDDLRLVLRRAAGR